jgi:death-on-curing protein
MRYVTLGEVVELHRRLLQMTGGTPGIRDLGALESAVAQPKATFVPRGVVRDRACASR